MVATVDSIIQALIIMITQVIDYEALKNNYFQIKKYAPDKKIIIMAKANGYGLGALNIINYLSENNLSIDAIGVARISEALYLRKNNISLNLDLIVFSEVITQDVINQAYEHNITLLINNFSDLDLINKNKDKNIKFWVKFDSGMNRLGFGLEDLNIVLDQANCSPVLVSHLACSDDKDHVHNTFQIDNFLRAAEIWPFEKSLCNSAGIINFPEYQYDWVRPGIMLYGGAPVNNLNAEDLGIRSVSKVFAKVMAIRNIQHGEYIGYGCTFKAPKDLIAAVVACGYADGYPRSASLETKVFYKGAYCNLISRVSMDTIVIDCSLVKNPQIGDEVEIWGDNVSIDSVAKAAKTISYELLVRLKLR